MADQRAEVDNGSAIGGVASPSLVNNIDADSNGGVNNVRVPMAPIETAIAAAIHERTAAARRPPVVEQAPVAEQARHHQRDPPYSEYESYEGNFDFEVVGLENGSNGRSCCQHDICGKYLLPRDVVRLVKCVVTSEMGPEEAIKLVRIMDGNEGCTIGFIPRVQGNLPKIQNAVDSCAQVLDIYKHSKNETKQFKSKRNQGMCCCILLNEILQKE